MPYKDPEVKKQKQKEWREKNKGYGKKWASENREKSRAFTKKWREKNKEKVTKSSVDWHNAHPWVKAYNGARRRCSDSKAHNYNRYGGRGIECLVTRDELKVLWFRDNAFDMEHPSLDRIDNDGNYTFDNCQFMELSDNVKKMQERAK